MAASTGPAIAMGAITWANQVVISPDKPADMFATSARIAVGTGIAVGALTLVDKASPQLAKGVAWLALVAVLFTRINGRPSPTENLLKWWNETEKGT